MKPVALAKLTALLAVRAMANAGCVHTQQPERRIYVIAEDTIGVGSNVESGTGGAGAEAYCSQI